MIKSVCHNCQNCSETKQIGNRNGSDQERPCIETCEKLQEVQELSAALHELNDTPTDKNFNNFETFPIIF